MDRNYVSSHPYVSSQVWACSRWFFLARLGLVGLLALSGHPRAGLELGYKAATVTDFPVSLLYPFSSKAGPVLADIVGPMWWFYLPIAGWWRTSGWRSKSRRGAI